MYDAMWFPNVQNGRYNRLISATLVAKSFLVTTEDPLPLVVSNIYSGHVAMGLG